MQRKTVYIDPLDKPKATPDPPPLRVVDKPGRHHFATRRKHFYVCGNCGHWEVFQWIDQITGQWQSPMCWTCGSKYVVHSSQRPIVGDINILRTMPLSKLLRICDKFGIEVEL